jgi:DNA-binding response OmpR family regulator
MWSVDETSIYLSFFSQGFIQVRSLLKTLLELEGFSVSIINNISQESIENSIKSESPALLLMDVHLQKVNGLDLLKYLKGKFPAIKYIMSSGMDMRYECSQAGADHFIMKPYMPDELIHLIQTYGK